MGNYVSCTLAPPLMKNSKATRVIIPTGEVKQFREIVKAAELMLEHPSYFLVNSRSLHIGRRFSALGADEELESGNVYIFFPMRRVNSVVTPTDMAVLFLAANSAAKRLSGGKARVLPDTCDGGAWQHKEESSKDGSLSEIPRLSLEGVEFCCVILKFNTGKQPERKTFVILGGERGDKYKKTQKWSLGLKNVIIF